MIFNLLHDLSAALAARLADHPRRRVLKLLEEALRRDGHFIASHPRTLFQCLWNHGWWYDCAESGKHHDLLKRTGEERLPWELPPGKRLLAILEKWRQETELQDRPLT